MKSFLTTQTCMIFFMNLMPNTSTNSTRYLSPPTTHIPGKSTKATTNEKNHLIIFV